MQGINDLLERIPVELHRKIIPDIDGCFIFTGKWNSGNGYKKVWWEGVGWAVHRLVYTFVHGEIEEGFVIDHLCRNRQCCNPLHLEKVTIKENTYRGNARLFKPIRLTDAR
jgi:hypothetical protein